MAHWIVNLLIGCLGSFSGFRKLWGFRRVEGEIVLMGPKKNYLDISSAEGSITRHGCSSKVLGRIVVRTNDTAQFELIY